MVCSSKGSSSVLELMVSLELSPIACNTPHWGGVEEKWLHRVSRSGSSRARARGVDMRGCPFAMKGGRRSVSVLNELRVKRVKRVK